MATQIKKERELCSEKIKKLVMSCKSKYGGVSWNIFWRQIVYGALPTAVKYEKRITNDFISITLIDSKNIKSIDDISLPIRYEQLLYACMAISNSNLFLTIYSSWQLEEPYDPYVYFQKALEPFEEVYLTKQNTTDQIICEEDITTSPHPEFIQKKPSSVSNKKLRK